MDKIYSDIWKLAKPYYQKGRSHDIPHIEWMMGKADRIAGIEGLEKRILLPTCILHDVGYVGVNGDIPRCKDKELKILHMEKGAQIADNILTQVSYDPKLAEVIVYNVSVHDNWILNDSAPFKNSREMALFNDLDFLWGVSNKEIFEVTGRGMGLGPKETYEFWLHDEKLAKRPFCCKETQKMWKLYMAERKKEFF
ncbi:MAG: hypothetical protein PHC66_04635 [Candidatus Nanoarchaeia archaeon]|nr:hypothetical protein [Candidatus Nanoarchaeia archaeon]MDD5239470.1 hypothetical protein [Candidatus Nanoarchaeia archaeon]